MATGESKRLRLSIVVSRPMMIALQTLAEREEIYLATMTTRVLRQALDRTINSAAVQEKIREHNAHRTHQQWLAETMTEHLVETSYAPIREISQTETTTTADDATKNTEG